MLSLAESLAGLGLLFIGLRLMSSQLQQTMGRRIRGLLRAATRTTFAGFAAGTLAGAITQSSNAVAVISGNLVRARVLSTREAIPVVAGGNVGTAALVLLAAVNFHLAVLVLVGVVGLGFQLGLDRKPRSRGWMSVILGFALLFLGIDFIKAAPHSLEPATLDGLVGGLAHILTPATALALGLVAAMATQSSSTATILVLAALKTGLVGLDSCFFAVVGANLGSGLATLVASGGLKGIGRQLCVVHIIVKGAGSGVLLALYLAAPAFGLDPLELFARLGNGDPGAAISMLFLILQLVGAVPVSLGRTHVARLATRFSPPSLEDDFSQPRFVDPAAADDPSGALVLSSSEIDSLIRRLPDLLPDLDRPDAPDAAALATLWRGGRAVAETTEHFVVDLIGRGLSAADLDAALAQQARLEMVRALQDTLAEFAALTLSFTPLPPLAFNLSESLRMMTVQVAEATGGDVADLDFLIDLSTDRGEHLNRIRRHVAASAVGAAQDAQRLLLATSQFERAVWLIHRVAITLRAAAGARGARDGIAEASVRSPDGTAMVEAGSGAI